MKRVEDLTEFCLKGHVEITLDDNSRTLCGLVGLKVVEDGRIWICIDGQALIRFKPLPKEKKDG